jgi:hypothetical protein
VKGRPTGLELARGPVQGVGAAGVDDEISPVVGEVEGEGPPEPLGRSGDDGDRHWSAPFLWWVGADFNK